MTTDQILCLLLLAVSIALFAWGRIRYDVVAVCMLVVAVLADLVTARQAFSGFSHPAVVTVAAVLIISSALRESGLTDMLGAKLTPLVHHPVAHVGLLTLLVALASAFINNVAALSLLLPVALGTAARQNRSPAMLLMPMSFGSLLGGLCTLIGTPPNIIISGYREKLTGTGFGLFEFSPVGLGVAVVGVAFVVLVGWRLIPDRGRADPGRSLFRVEDYVSEAHVPPASRLVGRTIAEAQALAGPEVDVVGLARGDTRAMATAEQRVIRAQDVVVITGDAVQVRRFVERFGLALVGPDESGYYDPRAGNLALVEGVVMPGSVLTKRTVATVREHAGNAVAVVALARHDRPGGLRLRAARFKVGDVLLMQGPADSIDDIVRNLGLLPLAERLEFQSRHGQPLRLLAVFGAGVLAAALGLVPLTIALVSVIVAYLAMGALRVRKLYRGVEWPIVVLLGAFFPIGTALTTTGTTDLIAAGIDQVAGGAPLFVLLGSVLVLTMLLTDVLNNATTALVMAPIAAGVAGRLGLDVDPFLMAVAVGASSAFLTPIGHQSNTLVMGPGGYRFSDYWRMGLPLQVLIVLVSVPLILWVWPP